MGDLPVNLCAKLTETERAAVQPAYGASGARASLQSRRSHHPTAFDHQARGLRRELQWRPVLAGPVAPAIGSCYIHSHAGAG